MDRPMRFLRLFGALPGWVAQAVSLAGVLLAAPPAAAQQEACATDPAPTLYVFFDKRSDAPLTDEQMLDLTEVFAGHLFATVQEQGGKLKHLSEDSMRRLLGQEARQQAVGSDQSTAASAVRAMGSEWILRLKYDQLGAGIYRVDGQIVNTRSGAVVHGFNKALPADTSVSPAKVAMSGARAVMYEQAEIEARDLACTLRARRVRPVIPQVTVELVPSLLGAGQPLTARATLWDRLDDSTMPGRSLVLTHFPPGFSEQSFPDVRTDFSGNASQALVAGSYVAGTPGRVTAAFPGADGSTEGEGTATYTIRQPAGALSLTPGSPKLRPGQADSVGVNLAASGAPVPGATVAISASAGSVGAATVVTSAQGAASVPYQAPSAPSFTVVTARGPQPPSGGPGAEGSLTYVVDAGVAMNLRSRNTQISSPAIVTVDLTRDGQALASQLVSFRLTGAGFLDLPAATTDGKGHAEVVFAAPLQAGASTVTATAIVDGQSYTRAVTIRYVDERSALEREIEEVIRLVKADPVDANLRRLATLRDRLRALGQDERAERVLDLLDGTLYCVHQLADDRCRSGSGLPAVQTTLDLLRSIATGSALLEGSLLPRVVDTRRFCPYPAFMQGSVWDENATVRPGPSSLRSDAAVAYISISSWKDDLPASISFNFKHKDQPDRIYVYGSIALTEPGVFSGKVSDAAIAGWDGTRPGIAYFQAQSTQDTARLTVGKEAVSAEIALYDYCDVEAPPDCVKKVATATMNGTAQLPAPPTGGCGQSGGD